MDDSPRSSKRRRLDVPDTSNRTVPTPPVKSTLKRASGRQVNRPVSYAVRGALEDVEEEEEEGEVEDKKDASPTRKGKLPRKATNTPSHNGTLRKRTLAVGKDVYDDFEGALSPIPKRRAANTPRTGTSLPRISKRTQITDATTNGDISDDIAEANGIPKSQKTNGAVKGGTPSRSAFREIVNGYKHGPEVDEDTSDAPLAESPTKKRTNSRAINGSTKKLASTPRSVGRPPRTPAKASKEEKKWEKLQTNGTNGIIPSKVGSTKKASTSVRKSAAPKTQKDKADVTTSSITSRRKAVIDQPSTVPDSEDELGDLSPSRSMSAKSRRRTNRTDHVGNGTETIVPSDDEQAEISAAEDDDDLMGVDGDSILGSVLDPTEPSPFNKPTSAQKEKDFEPLLQVNFSAGRELDLLKSIVMERITAKRPAPLIGLDTEYKTVYQLIEQTITAGEGNSMLLIGARASGKTALVNKVLSEISKDNREDYHVVRLNGFIHTDDKIALREIWRQLGKEMDIEEDGGLGKNYADTLTTLLALLSHPSEHTGELTDQVAKAVVFVMDEFDLFATHPRQTLLYNLFDIAQSRKAPIAVLGLTTRIDVANSLEKRVKSRFSHRYVHLSLAGSFTAFQELSKASLLIESDQLSIEERSILSAAPSYTPSKKAKSPKKSANSSELGKTDFLAEWNRSINALFASKSFLTTFLAPHFYRTKSIPQVLTSFLLPTALLSFETPSLQPITTLSAPDSKLSLIPNLSTLALALLISAARLDIIHDSDTCNFNMAYDEYVTLASKARIQSAAGGASASGAVSKVWGKEVARREWEGLVELGLCMPVVGGVTGAFGMVKVDVALEEIGAVLGNEKGVDKSLERWCRQL